MKNGSSATRPTEDFRHRLVKPGKKVLALIAARGGSKGLHRKNVLPAAGKPLIAWTVEAAKLAKCVDRVVLSSDDDEIMAAATAAGCEVPFRRPDYLACDKTGSIDVALHALDQVPGYEYVALLQPTSPLRTAADIDGAFTVMVENSAPSCASICRVKQSPYWMYQLSRGKSLKRIIPDAQDYSRRQELPETYVLNGAIYIAEVEWLRKNKRFVTPETVAFVMSEDASLDIDTQEDFDVFKSRVESGTHAVLAPKNERFSAND